MIVRVCFSSQIGVPFSIEGDKKNVILCYFSVTDKYQI